MAKEFDGLYEQIMQRKQVDRLKRRIHSAKFWGTFGRILSFPEENQYNEYIELSLVPVNGIAGDWDVEIEPIMIRHFDSENINLVRDKFYIEVPEPVALIMIENIGAELTSFLLEQNFMEEINLDKLFKESGPVNFGKIKKDNV